jgi:hypothetical protein
MHKNATKCNKTRSKWCKNKHGASKIIDTFETYQLTTCLTLTSRHKPLWSFGFSLVIPLYASVNDVLSLCMIMAVIALLVGHSQYFASLHFVLRGNTSRASNSQKPSFPMCPPYLPISNLLFQSHSSCFYLSFKLNFLCYVKISQ